MYIKNENHYMCVCMYVTKDKIESVVYKSLFKKSESCGKFTALNAFIYLFLFY
jgi:bacterioferritin-associated ferredoxin